jgi:ferrous iron transport protein B
MALVPMVTVSARTGAGIDDLKNALTRATTPTADAPSERSGLEHWADALYAEVASARAMAAPDRVTDRLDRAFTHPVIGVLLFALVMTGLFWVIFRLAVYPMGWIDAIFATLGGAVARALPEGPLQSLLVDGAIAGVGATVIFLPQILLLFLLLALLEGTGYLARAAFVIDRLMRPFGLPGHAFVPLLSSHACALPGIMAARAVPDRRDRLATILCAPFMSCTARIPVYVLLTSLLFPGRPALQALAFTGCYVFGAMAGLLSAMLARRTILRGASRPMALELPSYRLPDVRLALLTTLDRGLIFLKKAGLVILTISVALWWLGEYPHSAPPAESVALRTQAEAAPAEEADALRAEADRLDTSHSAQRTFLGRIGGALTPIFAPMGADRQLTIGILASFAAREVFVSTMAVQVVGSDDLDEEGVFDRLSRARRDDGAPLFPPATSWALLVYYVLAMQCLPTLAVTAREAGHVKWALLQLGWMSGLAYVLSVALYQSLRAAGVA